MLVEVSPKDEKKFSRYSNFKFFSTHPFDLYGEIKHCRVSHKHLSGGEAGSGPTNDYWGKQCISAHVNIPASKKTLNKFLCPYNSLLLKRRRVPPS